MFGTPVIEGHHRRSVKPSSILLRQTEAEALVITTAAEALSREGAAGQNGPKTTLSVGDTNHKTKVK